MTLYEQLKSAIFYSAQSPSDLANILIQLFPETVLANDLTSRDVFVSKGTALEDAKSMLNFKAYISQGNFTGEAQIIWGETTVPTYNAELPGKYVIEGTLSNLSKPFVNTDNKKVSASINVLTT